MTPLLDRCLSMLNQKREHIALLSPVILLTLMNTTGFVGVPARSVGDVLVAAIISLFLVVFLFLGYTVTRLAAEIIRGGSAKNALRSDALDDPLAWVLLCVIIGGGMEASAQRRNVEWEKLTDECIRDELLSPTGRLTSAGILEMVQSCRSTWDPDNS